MSSKKQKQKAQAEAQAPFITDSRKRNVPHNPTLSGFKAKRNLACSSVPYSVVEQSHPCTEICFRTLCLRDQHHPL